MDETTATVTCYQNHCPDTPKVYIKIMSGDTVMIEGPACRRHWVMERETAEIGMATLDVSPLTRAANASDR